jgi:hypothetical protein
VAFVEPVHRGRKQASGDPSAREIVEFMRASRPPGSRTRDGEGFLKGFGKTLS